MPRRKPCSLRPRAVFRSGGLPRRYRDIPGLSGRANAAIRLYERDRAAPGSVCAALRMWAAAVRSPRAWRAGYACPCCDPEWGRGELAAALHALPVRAARELRGLVTPLDDLLLRRGFPDPYAAPGLP